MLQDPRAKAKLRNFFHHWLEMDKAEDISKDPKTFPDFNESVQSDLRTSLDTFLEHVVWSEASDYRQLLLADYLFLNGRLAKFCGVEVLSHVQSEPLAAAREESSTHQQNPDNQDTFPRDEGRGDVKGDVRINKDGPTSTSGEAAQNTGEGAVQQPLANRKTEPSDFQKVSFDSKQRLIIMFSPNGIVPSNFWPEEAGEEFTLKRILEPLEPFKKQTLTLRGVSNKVRGDGDSHMRGMSCLLTGIELFPGNIQGGSHTPAGWPSGISIDQEIKNFFQSRTETRTRFGSLEFGVAVPPRADPWTRLCYAGPRTSPSPRSMSRTRCLRSSMDG